MSHRLTSLRHLLLTGWLVALPGIGAANPPDEDLLLTAARAERVMLPAGSNPTLEIDAISSRLILRHPGSRDALASALRSSGICPRVEVGESQVVLHCETRRLDARIVQVGARRALDIRALRGLPWKEGLSGPPLVPVDPMEAGLGGPCPGTTPVAMGECALARGDRSAAEKHFREEPVATGHASIRLGDLALLDDRPARAAWHFQQAATAPAPFGRLAEARLCELLGHCLGGTGATLFQSEGLPAGLRSELDLRAARMEAFLGDPNEAARFLVGRMASIPAGKVCPEGQRVCEAIALAAFRTPGARGKEDALALYFALPDRLVGPGAATLAAAAADVCAGLGAPVFGANLLAATTGTAAKEDLEAHLHHAARLYVQGGDRIRAGVIVDYVRFRFGAPRLETPRWRHLADRLDPSDSPSLTLGVAALTTEAAKDSELLGELAKALVAAAKARSLQTPTP